MLRRFVRAGRRRWHLASARTLRNTALDLGGLLLKAGQYLSTRSDLLPPAYIEALGRLQDRVPPHPYRVVRRVIEEELGSDPDQLFARFWRRPVASASLAQVHRAVLDDGRHVAVKVQRPEIRAAVAADLRNLRVAVQAIERIEGGLGLRALLDELEVTVPRELDFAREAESARALARNFAGQAGVRIPAVIDTHTRGRVLVTDYVSGIKITDTRRLKRAGVPLDAVAERLLDAYARQILHHRLFHADPHPGNLLVVPGDDSFELAFVDFGLVQEVPAGFREQAMELAARALAGDATGTAAALGRLGLETEAQQGGTLQRAAELLVELLRRRRDEGRGAPTRDLGDELVAVLRADPLVRMPAHLWLIGRVVGLLRGVWTSLGQPQELARGLLPYLVRAP